MNEYESVNDLPEKYRKQAESKLNHRKRTSVRESKYGNHVSEINGIKFDSKKEGRRYLELLDKLKYGDISDLRLQTQFTLIEGFKTVTGETVKPERYVADFTYFENGKFIVEDVKSDATKKKDVYKIKKKQMLDIYGIEVKEV